MWRPSKYDISDKSLKRFAVMFNAARLCPTVICDINKEETFDNDGYFVDTHTNQCIGFDWEIRDRYFKNGVFSFSTLGQYERKIRKPSIDLSVQCDISETAIIVAWHNDFKREMRQLISCATDQEEKENATIRYTDKFRIYHYVDITEFKKMISAALITNVLDYRIFEWQSLVFD